MTDVEFWILFRRALLMICAAIEKRFICKQEETQPEATNISTDYFEKG